MEPYDDRSKDLVVDLLLLASIKAGSEPGRPGVRDALRTHDGTFPPDCVDLTAAWDLLQTRGGVPRNAASDACAFVKTLEHRLGIPVRAPLAAVTRPKAKLVGDAEVERFFTAAAIRPSAPGTRSFPGILNHTIGGHSVAANLRVTASGSLKPADAPPPVEETTDVREQHALDKLDALYRPEAAPAQGAGVPRAGSSAQPRVTGQSPAVRGTGRRAALATEAAKARARKKTITAAVLTVTAVALVAFVLVPSLRDGAVPPRVLAPGAVEPLKVSDVRLLGPDAQVILVDEPTFMKAPLEQRQQELVAALERLRPYKIVRLTVRAGDHVVASAQRQSERIVVRFGR